MDVFDAMTCKRPYRDPLHVSFALEYLIEQATRRRMDRDAVMAWIEMVRWMLRGGGGKTGGPGAATLAPSAAWEGGPA